MNIIKLLKFLQEKDNRLYFSDLPKEEELTVNDIHKLIKENPDKPIKEMLSQIKLQKQNIAKNPLAFKLLFSEQGAQQASSWQLANYHAKKFEAFSKIADLCCGIGIDLMDIAKNKELVYAVDLKANILKIAEYNCNVNNLQNVEFVTANAADFNKKVDAIFIDPDRRPGHKRKIDPEQYSPPLSKIIELRKICPNIAVKLSPAIYYNRLELPDDSTLEFVSEHGTLKEILLCFGKLHTENCKKKAVLHPLNLQLMQADVKIAITEIQAYLFEPDPAIIRAGLVQELGQRLNYQLIDSKLALLTGSENLKSDFGKLYEVKMIMKYDIKNVRKYVRENEIGELIIKTRGFPETVEQFRKKIKLKGNKSIVMFILRKCDDHMIVFAQLKK